jgi:poly-gamma-glutamate synthesis protein (capsule biosynthesis protein)
MATLAETATPVATPTPAPLRVWASPALPDGLRLASESVQAIGSRPIEWVEDPQAAEVRIGPDPERPLSSWVYAVVAPFPTLTDGLSLMALAESWSAGSGWMVAPAVAEALASKLGETPAARVAANQLLEAAWSARPAYAIVPFEELDPRWKVLEIDGQSPIRKDFSAETYPLIVEFGLSGDPAGVEAVQSELDWPNSNRDPNRMTVLVMTGVTALVRATAWRMDRNGVEYPGLEIGGWLREADLAHVSHEAAFNPDCPPPEPFSSSLRFCANPGHAALFETLGVDLIELTGNHLQDYGPQALRFTLDLYAELGMWTFGGGVDLERARQPALIEHNGNRLAFLGCNAAGPRGDWAADRSPGALSCQDEGLLDRLTELRARGYLVVFTFQWPESLSPYPLPDQVEAFRAAADAGADIVNGSQAHRPQAMEFYGDSFIHYGLGNLFFDQMHALALRQEFLDRHVFYEGRHISVELLTALLEDYAQPRPMTPQERTELLAEMFAVSGW